MAAAKPIIAEGTVAEANDGSHQIVYRRGQWLPVDHDLDPHAAGAPFLPKSPMAGGPSEEAYYNQFRQKDDPSQASAQSARMNALRMEGLLSKQKTGGIYSVPILGGAAGMFDPEIREMDALQSEQARHSRQPGEGTISDYDAKQFLQQTYGKDKPTETNQALIRAQRMGADMTAQHREFMDWYKTKFNSLSGAPEAWNRYAQDNTIFDPSAVAQGQVALNPNRQHWRAYFGASRGPADDHMTATEADVHRTERQPWEGKPKPAGFSQALPKAQLSAAKMFAGSKAPAGDQRNPFVPTSAEEFNAIPVGKSYVDDDGKIYTKGAR